MYKIFIIAIIVFLYSSVDLFSQVKLYLKDFTTKVVLINESLSDSLRVTDMNNIKSMIAKKDINKEVKLFTILSLGEDKLIEGKLVDISDESYSIFVNEGLQTIPKKLVLKLDFKEVKDRYVSFGATVGSPAIINALISYNAFKTGGIRLSGLTGLTDNSGYQIELYYNLSNSKNFESNISVMKGESKFIDVNQNSFFETNYLYWNYYGAAVDLNYYGLFGQFGLSMGSGDFSSPQLMFQLGYVHRFN